MHAALVTAFDRPPTYAPVAEPSGPGLVLTVLAAGLHPRVRSQAAGTHYTSTAELPLVPGIDGVGRDPDGALRYFVLPDTTLGSMAERTLVDPRRSVVLPVRADAGTDPDVVALAAGMNPALSAWVALRRRVGRTPASVLVLGATGSAGRMAVQVARHLGATRVLGAGRRPERMADLPLDGALDLGEPGDLTAAADVDLVLDYLWGEPAAAAMATVVTARPDRAAPLTWVQIGSVAGPTAAVPSAALRASRLTIVGSGQGSVPTADIVAELPALAAAITGGALRVDARALPLAEVGAAWADDSGHRLVLVP